MCNAALPYQARSVVGKSALGLTAGGRFFVWVRRMVRKRKHYRIGVIFSTTGPYRVVARSMLNGALLAFREIAASGSVVALEPVLVDPAGDLARYRACARAAKPGALLRRTSERWGEPLRNFTPHDQHHAARRQQASHVGETRK